MEKEEKAKRVREKGRMTPGIGPDSARKGSLKDVFINAVKPYEDPALFLKTQKQILRNDRLRLRSYSKTDERVQLMSRDRRKRSSILGDIS